MRLSDTIEQFIKEMLTAQDEGVELKRNELAEYFHCAPSQINYVLSTRFTQDDGYVIKSKRGGGGFIHIVQVLTNNHEHIDYLLKERITDCCTERECEMFIHRLLERNTISKEEANLILSALSNQAFSVPIQENLKNTLRAKILRSMLIALVENKNND